MKKSKLFLAALFLAFTFVSCQDSTETKTTLVSFEDVVLPSEGYWNGSDMLGTEKKENSYGSLVTNYYGSFTSANSQFQNIYTKEWNSWMGFACSSKTDTIIAGFGNQYSVYAGSGANNSKNFGIAYSQCGFKCNANGDGNYSIKSVMLTNSTYSYKFMKNGDSGNGSDINSKFVADDWFKVTLIGYLSKNKTKAIDYYLADFRNGKSFISKTWEKVDLSSLGVVDSISLTINSSNAFTPAYVCIDNIEFTQTISTK